jgi:hypothetical protein
MQAKKRTIIMVLAIAIVCSFATGQVNAKPNPLNNAYIVQNILRG